MSTLLSCPLSQREFAKLLRDASEGLPVGGRDAPWEEGRPTKVANLEAQKPRGFISYERRCVGWPSPPLLP